MLGHPSLKILQKILDFIICFSFFMFAFLLLFLVPLACKGTQNGCLNGSGNHENRILAAVAAESQEKL